MRLRTPPPKNRTGRYERFRTDAGVLVSAGEAFRMVDGLSGAQCMDELRAKTEASSTEDPQVKTFPRCLGVSGFLKS